MSYISNIQKILNHIDDNLDKDLSVDILAEIANFSPYHFCRIFQWYVGYPVMKYVRIRRLEYVASEFSTGKKIIDIAMRYGFETYSGFAKAFKRHYGIAPEKYRIHNNIALPILSNLIHMNSYSIGGVILNPKFITHDTIKLVGYELKTTTIEGENSKEIPAFWQACIADGRLKKLHHAGFVKNHIEYGACFSIDPETGGYSYVIGVEAEENVVITDDFSTFTLPPATYAVFSTPPAKKADFTKSIQGTWQYIMNDWFPNSGYEYAPNCVDFEYFDRKNMSVNENVCDIYIPVVKVKNFD